MKLTLPVCLRKALLTHLALGAAFVFSAPAPAESDKVVTEDFTESTSATYSDVTVSPGVLWTIAEDKKVSADAVAAEEGAVLLESGAQLKVYKSAAIGTLTLDAQAVFKSADDKCATIDNLIRDTLWNELPECYDEPSISRHRQRIYEHVYTRYKDVA
jgi:hypothetical protein